MQIGRLRHRVALQTVSEARSSTGAVTETWNTTATVWAEVVDLAGREFWDARQVNAELTARIRIRYRSGIVPKMRAVFGARTFDIQSVIDPEGRRRELVLMCRELV